jgi:transposase-like protein
VHNDSAVSSPLTAWQDKLFRRRQEKLRMVTEYLARGYTRTAAASESGIAVSWLWTLERRFRLHGLAGLIPTVSKGVPPLIDPTVYTTEVVSELQRLAVKLGGPRAAARAFANDPSCPPELAHYIRRRNAIPDALRKRIGYRRYSRPIRLAGQFAHIEGLPVQPRAAA